eukprot:SAG11_NODE_13777_length_640_cov_0.874307_1_plen_99_part_10
MSVEPRCLQDSVEKLLYGGDEEDEQPTFSVDMTQPGGGARPVPVTGEPGVPLQKVLDAQVFKDWVKEIEEDQKLFIAAIHVQVEPPFRFTAVSAAHDTV